jgi:hypothetical protein
VTTADTILTRLMDRENGYTDLHKRPDGAGRWTIDSYIKLTEPEADYLLELVNHVRP